MGDDDVRRAIIGCVQVKGGFGQRVVVEEGLLQDSLENRRVLDAAGSSQTGRGRGKGDPHLEPMVDS